MTRGDTGSINKALLNYSQCLVNDERENSSSTFS